MKKTLLSKVMLLLMCILVGVGSAWAEDVTLKAGTNGTACKVNNQDGIKVGTSSKGGDMTITVPAKTSTLKFHAAAWKGVSGLSLNITGATVSPSSISLTADDGISNNSPFTLSGDEDDFEFKIALSNITEETTLTFTSSTAKRFVVWGASAAPAAPTFDIVEGEFSAAFDLTITGAEGTTLKYTTDGSDPADGTAVDNNETTITIPAATTTVRAIAIKDGKSSEETSATYTYVDASKQNPTFTLSDTELNLKVNEEGEIELTTNSDGTVTMTCNDAAVSIEQDGGYALASANAAGTYTVNVALAATNTYNAANGTVTLNVTKKATTVTIDASAIGDTDLYTTDNENLLGATVKYGEATVAGATVTWTSSKTDVATIDEDGIVTLVQKGTTTITASYAGNDEYEASSNTYELTVTDSKPYVQPTSIEITPNYTFWGKTAQFSGNANDNLSGSKDNVSLAWSRGNGSTYANTTAMRFYKDNTLTFTAPTGYEIKSIVLEGTLQSDLAFLPAGFDSESQTWTGAATTVTMSRPSSGSGYATISKYTITLGVPSSIATPTFSLATGTYDEAKTTTISCGTDGATIYYTLDGTTPTAESTEYTGAIDITESCTLKAIAIKDGESSAVASATYTIELPYTQISEVKKLSSGTSFRLNLTGAQVVYIDNAKKNIYVRDASGAIDIYNNSGFSTTLTTGDILSGTIEGTYSPYKNLPEITNVADIAVLTKTGNETVVAKVIEGTTDAIQANLCDLVKIENTEITESSSKYYVGENSDIQLYDNFGVGYTATTGKAVDVSGIATVYNETYELFPRFESDIVYLENSVAVAIGANGMATFSSDKALDFTAVDAIDVFIAKVSGAKVVLEEVKKVPANTAVILRNALGAEQGAVDAINVPVLDGDADDVTGNELKVSTGMKGGEGIYCLAKHNGVLGFYLVPADRDIPAGKAYLEVANAARDFFGFADEATGISTLGNERIAADGIYNLNGQRVAAPQKGLYIVNGKKYITK